MREMSEDHIQPSSTATSNLSKLVSNSLSLLTSDIVNRATIFVVYLSVARYLGASEFGKMSLALSLFNAFQVLAMVGLKALITREVAKDKSKTDRYLVNGSLVVTVTSLLSIIILLLFAKLMNYSRDTASVILLLSLGLIPFSLSTVCEAVFQAWERMHYIAIANVPVSVARIVLTLLLLMQGQNLHQLVLMLVISFAVVLVIEWLLMIGGITKPHFRLDPRFSLAITRSSRAFFGIRGLIAIRSSLYIVLLSKLATETEVGHYNAAVQFTVPLILIYGSIGQSIFPAMCRHFESNLLALRRIAENTIELLLAIALPAAVGLFFLAGSALSLVYGEGFELASGVLQIVAWSLILRAPTQVLGQVLWAGRREKISFRIVVINTLVRLISGWILISLYGLIGAAISGLGSAFINLILHHTTVSRQFFKVTLGRLAWKPIVATVFMGLYLSMINSQWILLVVLSAGALYVGVMFALEIWSAGGRRHLKTKYLSLFSD
jgi:O-antigen/teichoic acid export membrane protein